MNTYNFQMIFKKGEQMPADNLSCHVVACLVWPELELASEQEADEILSQIKSFLASQELPQGVIRRHAEGCFIEDGLIWKKVPCQDQPDTVLPRWLIPTVLNDAHGHQLSGHNGIYQNKARIQQNYFRSDMDADIQDFI